MFFWSLLSYYSMFVHPILFSARLCYVIPVSCRFVSFLLCCSFHACSFRFFAFRVCSLCVVYTSCYVMLFLLFYLLFLTFIIFPNVLCYCIIFAVRVLYCRVVSGMFSYVVSVLAFHSFSRPFVYVNLVFYVCLCSDIVCSFRFCSGRSCSCLLFYWLVLFVMCVYVLSLLVFSLRFCVSFLHVSFMLVFVFVVSVLLAFCCCV